MLPENSNYHPSPNWGSLRDDRGMKVTLGKIREKCALTPFIHVSPPAKPGAYLILSYTGNLQRCSACHLNPLVSQAILGRANSYWATRRQLYSDYRLITIVWSPRLSGIIGREGCALT